MDLYRPPASNVEINTGRTFRPITAILLGLLVSLPLSMVVSVIEVIIFAVIFRVNLTDEKSIDYLMQTNTTFQVVDTVVSLLVLFFAGRVVRKYAPGKEILFGLIVASVAFIFSLYMAISSHAFSIYPKWYGVVSLLSIFIGIYLGSRPSSKH